jgi:hypothetical protein
MHAGADGLLLSLACVQVFDKALGEPGFSEIYATLCFDLNRVLPSFKVRRPRPNQAPLALRGARCQRRLGAHALHMEHSLRRMHARPTWERAVAATSPSAGRYSDV